MDTLQNNRILLPEEDGVTHLNLYSGARTELGRFCSNFARCPIETEDGHFESIEGYWGWLSVSEDVPEREELRNLYGFEAKEFKDKILKKRKSNARFDDRFSEKIAAAVHAKFQTKEAEEVLSKNFNLLFLPTFHYYVYKRGEEQVVMDVTEKYPDFMDNVTRELRAYKEKTPSLFGIREGVICQQVNCQDVMGAGLAKAIMEQYPVVSEKYHETFQRNSKESLFGKVDLVKIGENLYVANIYSQFYYGNPAKTGKVYTDAEKLARAVDGICKKLPNLPIYLPHGTSMEGKEEKAIGCGYGGESWGKLERMFALLGHKNLHLLDTKTCRVHELELKRTLSEVAEELPPVEKKHPFAKGMKEQGKAVEDLQERLAGKYDYRPLPKEVEKDALRLYRETMPSGFLSPAKREAKGGFVLQGKDQPVRLLDGTLLAKKYDRIVVGNYGAFLEIDKSDMEAALTTEKGEEFREADKYKGSVKYFWKTVEGTGTKVYDQQLGVSYADYKPGKYYISVHEVMDKDDFVAKGLSWNDSFQAFGGEEARQAEMEIPSELYDGRNVVFDLETTGLGATKGDEILQIAIVNEDGQEILNVYTKPRFKKSWSDAEAVNHISPPMVQDALHASSYSGIVQKIFDSAALVVGHNVGFDKRFAEACMGVKIEEKKLYDTCDYFKKDCKHYPHHKLEDAVRKYCPDKYKEYRSGAHDALIDTKATAAVFVAQMEKEMAKNEEQEEAER